MASVAAQNPSDANGRRDARLFRELNGERREEDDVVGNIYRIREGLAVILLMIMIPNDGGFNAFNEYRSSSVDPLHWKGIYVMTGLVDSLQIHILR